VSPWVWGFIAGLFVGTLLGIFVAALLAMASDERDRRRR
jgi:high-affinity Fe2+/Pb2+ permease